MNINAQQVILNAYISNNSSLFDMYAFRITCWVLIFIFRLRFPPGVLIASILTRSIRLLFLQWYIEFTQSYRQNRSSPILTTNVNQALITYVTIFQQK